MTFQAIVTLLGMAMLGAALAKPSDKTVLNEPEPQYQTGTVIELAAEVTEVREVKENPLSGVHLVVRTDSDATMVVYLGPAAFVKSFEISFARGDNVHIVGSKVRYNGGGIVLGREVRKDSTTLYLRNRNGDPYWQANGKPAS